MTLIQPGQGDAAQLHTGLDDGERKMLAGHLAQVLADTYVLMIKNVDMIIHRNRQPMVIII